MKRHLLCIESRHNLCKRRNRLSWGMVIALKVNKGGWVHRLLVHLKEMRSATEKDLHLYKIALENAYEAIVIADAEGCIMTASETYASLINKKLSDMIGRHVTEVIDNTRLHIVARTGKAEMSDLQQIQGHWMIASRIPIFDQGKVIAVVGRIMFRDIDELFEMNVKFKTMKSQLQALQGSRENSRISPAKYSFQHLIGVSEKLNQVKRLAEKVARTGSTVLISGETGTGKELFAHAIHRESDRFHFPFVTMNCAAIPETLFESELFGYKEGSFTGARKSGKKGKFALANKGTIFLDEISELPLSLQVKLLRVLQEKEIEPVGASSPEPVDVRIIAATNRNLQQLVEEGKFRLDLYYRLNVVMLEIPPLRERPEDIPLLVHKLLEQLKLETGIAAAGLEQEAERTLMHYNWPGNVRELRNVLERALFLKQGEWIAKDDLPHEIVYPVEKWLKESRQGQGSLAEAVDQLEKRLIYEAIHQESGDKLAAAQKLGISKSTLYKKLEKYER